MQLLPNILVLLAMVICAACTNHEEWGGHRPSDYDPRPYSRQF